MISILGVIKRDASPHSTFVSLELASRPTRSIDTFGSWYDAYEGCNFDEPALRLGFRMQQGVLSAPAQAQHLQATARSDQKGVVLISESMSVESEPDSLPKLHDSGNNGWTDDSMTELERTGVGFRRASTVIISQRPNLIKFLLGWGTRERDPGPRKELLVLFCL